MKEDKVNINSKRGYLLEDFQYFHLKDEKSIEFEFHHHDFNKIIIYISGKVTYLIEGKAYKLKPWDILFVSNHEVHKPIIQKGESYQRIIIWVKSEFLKNNNDDKCDLLTCFQLAISEKVNLLRLSSLSLINIKKILMGLDEAGISEEFGSHILKKALFLELMVYLNRSMLIKDNMEIGLDIKYDSNIADILDYINENLKDELTIEKISLKFFLSKYYLMHKFKKQTGYTINNYILQKRLILSSMLIKQGKRATEVCNECGFNDYSNFLRVYKNFFGNPPKKHYKKQMDHLNKIL